MKKQLLSTLFILGCFGIANQASAVPAVTTLTLDDIVPTVGSSAIKLPDGILQLTDNSRSDPTYQIGSAYSTSPVEIVNFTSSFSFKFSDTGYGRGSADGIVFVIKNPASVTSGGDGGGLGYGTITTGNGSYAGIPNSVGIEFDNWYNPEVGDPGNNHIGININGSVVSEATFDVWPEFNNNGPWYAWVDYDGSLLTVSVSQTNSKPGSAMLSYNIGSLQSAIHAPAAEIGFTGSTGWASQTEQVLSFNYFDPPGAVPEPGTVVLLGVGGALVSLWKRQKRKEATTD
ncbi:MAG: PEP-CTERM sorting domain-containing protein [Chlorobaculum sp.]|jgi:hypothetical protein|nr:PEP-CTERM sorting domain-containing protein [Chlorobaculum sp.]